MPVFGRIAGSGIRELILGSLCCWGAALCGDLPRAAAQLGAQPPAVQPQPPAQPATKPAAQPPGTQPPGAQAPPAAKVQPQPGTPGVPPTKPPVQPPTAKPKETGAPKEEELPPPEKTWVETRDGWKIYCQYYPPKPNVRKGQEVVPIILLHGWGGQGSEFDFLATGLQTYGHATIVPDLRGHGRSTTKKLPDGKLETFKLEDLTQPDIRAIVQDVEAVKKFLVDKNNAGEVNIEMLTVVGAEAGCIVALNWAFLDWSWPQTFAYKQGQDVKALVLLSPMQSHQRLNATDALGSPAVSRVLSIMIAVGKDDRGAYSEAKRIHSRLERIRPPVPKDPEDRRRLQDLFLVEAETTLQGTKLTARNLPVNRNIVGFIELRLVQKREDLPWKERKSPISGN